MAIVNEKQMVFTSVLVDAATNAINDGVILKRFQNPWLSGEVGIRRTGITFKMTADEQAEYIKCALDINYFAEEYCKTKREDGSIGPIKLRDYQENILDNYVKNRFNIVMSSRQSGKTITTAIFILHYLLFNNDKNVMIIANKKDTVVEIVDKIKSIYTLLPYFIKPGVKVWNQSSLTFENGCKIKTAARTKTPAIGFTIDLLFLDEMAHIPNNIIEPLWTAVFPTISSIKNSKIVITSTPNGMNLFHKLLTDGERPLGDPKKNNFNPLRIYWYQVPGRFVTYIRLNDHKMYNHGITKEEIFDIVNEKWGSVTKVFMEYSIDLNTDVIHVYNNDMCTDQDIKVMYFVDSKDREVPFSSIAELTTWKDEAIKDIGSEEGFNQEYDLRFINSSKSLLPENVIEELLKSKKSYEYQDIDELDDRLRFSYGDLTWVDDEELYQPINRKNEKILMSVDLSEGLGQDYSIINIFKIAEKPFEYVKKHSKNYKDISDFYCLQQIGIFRSNILSIKQMAELLYTICFEYFNPDNVKVVLELNTYGNTLLAELPHVFEGNNEYGSYIFFKYKHRVDSPEEKIGLKVNDNKNLMVKDYQDLMKSRSFVINNEDNIREITTFVRHTTSAGNTRYAADGSANDDTVMTVVNMSTIFAKYEYKEIVEEWMENSTNYEYKEYVKQQLNIIDDRNGKGVDYNQLLDIRRKNLNRFKNINNDNPFLR